MYCHLVPNHSRFPAHVARRSTRLVPLTTQVRKSEHHRTRAGHARARPRAARARPPTPAPLLRLTSTLRSTSIPPRVALPGLYRFALRFQVNKSDLSGLVSHQLHKQIKVVSDNTYYVVALRCKPCFGMVSGPTEHPKAFATLTYIALMLSMRCIAAPLCCEVLSCLLLRLK